MSNIEHDQNLMLVYATEGYAKRHGLSEKETFDIFVKYGVNNYLKKYYGVLHTQDFDEDVFFAEDLIERAKEKTLQEVK